MTNDSHTWIEVFFGRKYLPGQRTVEVRDRQGRTKVELAPNTWVPSRDWTLTCRSCGIATRFPLSWQAIPRTLFLPEIPEVLDA